jgi:hypothetical protein
MCSDLKRIGVQTVKAYFNVLVRHSPEGNNVLTETGTECLSNTL